MKSKSIYGQLFANTCPLCYSAFSLLTDCPPALENSLWKCVILCVAALPSDKGKRVGLKDHKASSSTEALEK